MRAGALRHLITVQRKSLATNASTGYRTNTWTDRVIDLAAQYLPGPGREYLASEALRAEVTGRFIVRRSTEALAITAGDRVTWDGRTFAIKSPPMPDATGRDSLTIMVSENGSDGS